MTRWEWGTVGKMVALGYWDGISDRGWDGVPDT